MKSQAFCNIYRLKHSIQIDADWNKWQWQNIIAVDFLNYMGAIPSYKPSVEAKVMYDEQNIYVIFCVIDRYVRCITKDINGPVWKDSCVEFFFSPDARFPEKYFNLEINCGGTPLMYFNDSFPRKDFTKLAIDDINEIEIAHSLFQIVDPEIEGSVIWTIEYRIPIDMLEKYASISYPKPGVEWRANLYKIAESTSNPHHITWSFVDKPEPDFHLPQFFGKFIFK